MGFKSKERHNEYHRLYYQKNKEKIENIRKQKIACKLCGSVLRQDNIKTHMNNTKCKKKQRIIFSYTLSFD